MLSFRVRRGKQPGQFYFSVLDNGVTSSEYWRILDCADDLSWAVFYYSGAASAAGTSYRGITSLIILCMFFSSLIRCLAILFRLGALLVSPDGSWPTLTPDTEDRIKSSLLRGGIQLWELYEVCNLFPYADESSNIYFTYNSIFIKLLVMIIEGEECELWCQQRCW